MRRLERFGEKHEGEFGDKYELIDLFIEKQAKKGIHTWFGIDFEIIFDELLSGKQSDIISEIESIDNADYSDSHVECQNATVTNETIQIINETVPNWIADNHTMIGDETGETTLGTELSTFY